MLDGPAGKAPGATHVKLTHYQSVACNSLFRRSPAAGQAEAVAGLAAAAQQCRLPAADVALARRAGWAHDLGPVTVSAAVWEKRGALTREERERVRLHAYHTERVFDGVPSLRPIAAVAALHHERGDG